MRTEVAAPRTLAAARGAVARAQVGPGIIRLLDQVWPLLREQGARTGHNVVIYYPGEGGELVIDAGVEVPGGFTARGEVRRVDTPAGEVAAVTHFGDYAGLPGAHAALERWCAASARRPSGTRWEVYGDWDADPAKVRTDVYYLLQA